VGVLLADTSLYIPDFRAAERTFQLITQVAGRAGRGNDPGRVIVQTFNPGHYALQAVADQSMAEFLEKERKARRASGYPPFVRLVQIRLDGLNAARVEEAAHRLGTELKKFSSTNPQLGKIQILGPSPAPISRVRHRYRWSLLLKGRGSRGVRAVAREARDRILRDLAVPGVRLIVDVDPIHML
jgi:primosomal protein N' (replication factor Y)